MRCPVCGGDCVGKASEILEVIPAIFSRCDDCTGRQLDKRLPPPDRWYPPPCACGKRFIDEVYAQMHVIMREDGILRDSDPLLAVGTPMVHPGFAMHAPPYLPKQSLVLLSKVITRETAERIVREVPEVRGVVKTGDFVPGVIDVQQGHAPPVYELLSGCDVRADVFASAAGSLVLYKQQSLIHIEFPRRWNPKVAHVESEVNRVHPSWFIDACAGVGTLGLTGALMGIPHVVLNDAWYAASFWAGFNLAVNAEFFDVQKVSPLRDYDMMKQRPVAGEPVRVAEATGGQDIVVYHGDFNELYRVLPEEPVLAVIDLFEKEDREAVGRIQEKWREHVAGEVFIP
jgi:hypothetical protein